MIDSGRIADYINSMNQEDPPWLAEIARRAGAEGIPIIRRETRELLKTMLRLKKPGRILEVGTAVGYSALYMKECLGQDVRITTIENYEPRVLEARDHFRRWDGEGAITLMPGDAGDILKELSGAYDFVFMDGAKGQYIRFLRDVARLLSKGGLLFSDNVLQDGDVAESRYAIPRRNHTIHSRMREYLFALKRSGEFTTSILPVGDGVALSVRE